MTQLNPLLLRSIPAAGRALQAGVGHEDLHAQDEVVALRGALEDQVLRRHPPAVLDRQQSVLAGRALDQELFGQRRVGAHVLNCADVADVF